MSSLEELSGCGTALVTPFDSSGEIDEKAMAGLVEFQIEQGIDFLVPCGTTGESATLSSDERFRVVDLVVRTARGRVPVIAGAGGNNTRQVIEDARGMAELGVAGLLSVTPYYNKPTQEGLFQHYFAIADSVGVDILLYNVPGRTAANLLPETVVRLSAHERIAGIKEASGNIVQISELAAAMPTSFRLLSGDDGNILPLIAVGGCGVISVTANVAPALLSRFTRACLENDREKATRLLPPTLDLARACFCETNPIPVKTALAMMGRIEERFRLPLVPLSEPNREPLRAALLATGVLDS